MEASFKNDFEGSRARSSGAEAVPYPQHIFETSSLVTTLVLLSDRPTHINDGQQHEDVCLQNCHYDMKPHEDNRNGDRNHRKEHERDQVAGENVGPEAD